MIKTKNFKEQKDGRYKITLADDVRKILIGRAADYLRTMPTRSYEYFLTAELIEALERETIKLRKSEFFLLFSPQMQKMIPETTQRYISAVLELDEVKRQMHKLTRPHWSIENLSLINK